MPPLKVLAKGNGGRRLPMLRAGRMADGYSAIASSAYILELENRQTGPNLDGFTIILPYVGISPVIGLCTDALPLMGEKSWAPSARGPPPP